LFRVLSFIAAFLRKHHVVIGKPLETMKRAFLTVSVGGFTGANVSKGWLHACKR